MQLYTAPNPPTDVSGVTKDNWPATAWPPIRKLKDQWSACTVGDGGVTCPFTDQVKAIQALFNANYVGCYGSGTPTRDQMESQVYQWSPFNANCTVHPAPADSNYHLLEYTTGYYTSAPGKTCDVLTGNNCVFTG